MISAKALEDMIFSKLRANPIARGVTVSVATKEIPQPDGTTTIQMIPTVGDIYMDEGTAHVIAKAVAESVYSHVQPELP
jgi:hypothetical protein